MLLQVRTIVPIVPCAPSALTTPKLLSVHRRLQWHAPCMYPDDTARNATDQIVYSGVSSTKEETVTTKDNPHRPYAPTSSIIAFCERARSRNLPEQISDEFFHIAGVTGQAKRRAQHALTFLGLLDQDGAPTAALRDLAAAPEGDWRTLLRRAVESSYEIDLANVDPATDDLATLRSWFQQYQPRSQTNPMTSLFIGLCRESGMAVKETPGPRSPRKGSGGAKKAAVDAGSRNKVHRSPADTTPAVQEQPITDHVPSNTPGWFDITPEVLGELGEDEFEQVSASLGLIAQAHVRMMRAKAKLSETNKDPSINEALHE